MLDAIGTAVAFDAYVWLMTDPSTAVGSSPLADVPCLPDLPRLIGLKYLTPVGRWTTPGRPPVLSLHEATAGNPAESLLWRELLAGHDVVDIASLVFVDRYGCWGFLDLWRTTAPFDSGELDHLTSIAMIITTALRRSQAATFVDDCVDRHVRPGPVVLLMSPDLDVRAQTPETEGVLRELLPPGHGAAPVPAAAYNVAAQLLAVEAGIDTHPSMSRVHVGGRLWVTLRAARIGEMTTAAAGCRDIAVTIEETPPEERVDLFSRAFGFSTREAELARQLLSGGSTREIARRLTMSEHTVTDHLKSIFVKADCHSRAELVSRALGG